MMPMLHIHGYTSCACVSVREKESQSVFVHEFCFYQLDIDNIEDCHVHVIRDVIFIPDIIQRGFLRDFGKARRCGDFNGKPQVSKHHFQFNVRRYYSAESGRNIVLIEEMRA